MLESAFYDAAYETPVKMGALSQRGPSCGRWRTASIEIDYEQNTDRQRKKKMERKMNYFHAQILNNLLSVKSMLRRR
jgi:hypothetical protein